MTDYKSNPDLALATLKKLTEEIPSGVSREDLGRILTELDGNSEECVANISNTIVSNLKDELDKFWAKYHVSEKLENVNKLKKVSGNTSTKEFHFNAQKAQSLQKIKESKNSETKKMQDRNLELMNDIRKYTPDTLTNKKPNK